MDSDEMQKRTKAFALRIIRLVSSMPKDKIGDVIGRQVLKSGTSIGANYAEAIRASTHRHFTTIIEIATREAAETKYWLELLIESDTFSEKKIGKLLDEAIELTAILTAMGKTARTNEKAKK